MTLKQALIDSCPEYIQGFAVVGQMVTVGAVWAFLGFLTSLLSLDAMGRKWSELDDGEKMLVSLLGGLFPITWVAGLLYLVIKWIILPFTAAEKKDLRVMEKRINNKIDEKCPSKSEEQRQTTNFKVGDLITGVRGNPDNYKHLNEGCICRVDSINDRGQMRLTLIGHKDLDKHKDYIGKEFKAPARNFVRYPRKETKSGQRKSSSRKKSTSRRR